MSALIESVYEKCAYKNCRNGKYSTGSHLFRFPCSTDTRHQLWIRNSGNINLQKWSTNSIRRAGLCADHFHARWFKDEDKKVLRRDAVPLLWSNASPETVCEASADYYSLQNVQGKDMTEIEIFNNEKTIISLPINDNLIRTAISSAVVRNIQERSAFAKTRTYVSPHLNFDVSSEDENIMEWVYLEPPYSSNTHNSARIIEEEVQENAYIILVRAVQQPQGMTDLMHQCL